MAKERTVIDQELCRKVEIMLLGAKANEVAKLLGIGESTVSRIKKAGFDAVQYNANTDRRRILDKNKAADKVIAQIAMQKWKQVETPEMPGQIKMNLTEEEEKPEMSEQTKMMRFQAHQVDRIIGRMEGAIQKLMENNTGAAYLITQKLDRLNDTLCQILRSIGSEKA